MTNEPVAVLKVVSSTLNDGLLSIRGPLGRFAGDSARDHITEAGFADGDDVVLIRKEYFDRLTAAAAKDEQPLRDILGADARLNAMAGLLRDVREVLAYEADAFDSSRCGDMAATIDEFMGWRGGKADGQER